MKAIRNKKIVIMAMIFGLLCAYADSMFARGGRSGGSGHGGGHGGHGGGGRGDRGGHYHGGGGRGYGRGYGRGGWGYRGGYGYGGSYWGGPGVGVGIGFSFGPAYWNRPEWYGWNYDPSIAPYWGEKGKWLTPGSYWVSPDGIAIYDQTDQNIQCYVSNRRGNYYTLTIIAASGETRTFNGLSMSDMSQVNIIYNEDNAEGYRIGIEPRYGE